LIFKVFRSNKIVPDVIEVAPSELVRVRYTSTNQEANLGNELDPKDTQEKPSIRYDADPDEFYTLAMIDPDVPRRKNPVQREWQNWLVVNIPGSDVANGDILSEYVGPLPLRFTELHRIVFLVYKQRSLYTFNEPHQGTSDAPGRMNFAIKDFAKKYRLGDPIAGNFFQAEYDDSVPAQTRKLFLNNARYTK